MKILLFGANGQLGHELAFTLEKLGTLKACTRADADLTDSSSILAIIHAFQPDIIVNAAAYTAVDKAETERNTAFVINAEAIQILAHEAEKRDIHFIHYSTDYVFDGIKEQPYCETDTPNAINTYGESKLAGEIAIKKSRCKYLIFRTTWVIGQHGQNFAKTILRLAKDRDYLNVIDDQIGVPTSPALISEVTKSAIEAIYNSSPWPSGIYHLSPHGTTTWHGIANLLLRLAKKASLSLSTTELTLYPISTAEYPTPAKRPKNSLLQTDKLEHLLPFSLPNWEDDFSSVAKDIIKEYKET
jgi:dTDP-4-dehydrorhamnose reductase